MPKEEDLNSWSHHYSTDTADDSVFRGAMVRGFHPRFSPTEMVPSRRDFERVAGSRSRPCQANE